MLLLKLVLEGTWKCGQVTFEYISLELHSDEFVTMLNVTHLNQGLCKDRLSNTSV